MLVKLYIRRFSYCLTDVKYLDLFYSFNLPNSQITNIFIIINNIQYKITGKIYKNPIKKYN